jgi:hypothetical protein
MKVPFACALVIVWPNGRFRVSSENGVVEQQAEEASLDAGDAAALEVVQHHRLTADQVRRLVSLDDAIETAAEAWAEEMLDSEPEDGHG